MGLFGGRPTVGESNWFELLLTYGVLGCTGKAGVCGRGLPECGGLLPAASTSLTEAVRHEE